MVSDGADTSDRTLDEPLASLKARVDSGLHGRRRPGALRARHPGDARRDAAHDAQGHVARRRRRRDRRPATRGRTVPLTVEDDGRIVGTRGRDAAARRRVGDRARAVHGVRGRARARSGSASRRRTASRSPEQRARRAHRGRRSPREDALLRRRAAVRGEVRPAAPSTTTRTCRSCCSQRTAENKYLRRNVDNPDELVGGFPKTREELFAYRGDHPRQRRGGGVHARAAAHARRLRQQRGGGLLMLGGRRVVRRRRLGRHAGRRRAARRASRTPRGRTALLRRAPVRPTRAGAMFPVTQMAGHRAASAARWNDLPPLSSVNPIDSVKPGATVLLTGLDKGRQDQVVLAYQRYGRGKAHRVAGPGLVALADGREDRRSPTRPTRRSGAASSRWLVDGVPEPGDGHDRRGSRRAGRGGASHGRGRSTPRTST